MSKEEILKIQKCVLKVNIHCDGCKHEVKKILQKIDGVFTTEIDAEQGKVTVTGNVDPKVLIKKLAKSGKHAELWGAPKPNKNNNNNQNYLVDQLKNMQINHPKDGGNHNSKGQNQKGGGNNNNNNNQAKGGGGQQGPTPQQQQQLQLQQQQLLQQQLQQLQQMKGLQDLNLPQFKDFKLPPHNPNAKSVKFDIPEEEDFSDDELDEFDDDEDFHDEYDDDEMDYIPPNKMKLPPMMMNAPKGGINGSGGNNGKKGGPVPIQVHGGIPDGGGKKGNSSGGNNLNQGGGNKNNGNKNGGGVPVGKNGGGNKNNNGGGNNNNNNNGGSKKGNPMAMGGVGAPSMNSGFQNMGGGPHVMSGPMSTPIPAVQGLPAAPVNGGGYFRGVGPDAMPGNPFHQQQQLQLQQQQQQQLQLQQQQQQYMAAMMNQQRAMGNDRFQPMMYARPPPAVNYMYPPYPYPPPDPYTHFFSDENTSSCHVM